MDIFGNSEDGSSISGPASSTTNALVRYGDTTGKLLKNSTVILGDDGAMSGLKGITPLTGWPLQLYGDIDGFKFRVFYVRSSQHSRCRRCSRT